jgi:hypothetical protein
VRKAQIVKRKTANVKCLAIVENNNRVCAARNLLSIAGSGASERSEKVDAFTFHPPIG